MKKNISIILFLGILLAGTSNVCAQNKETTRRYAMEIDQLINKVETIKRHLNRMKMGTSFPDVCKIVEKNADVRMSHFLKAKKAFEGGDVRSGTEALNSAYKVVKSDIERLENNKEVEKTGELLRLEQDLGRSLSSILRRL